MAVNSQELEELCFSGDFGGFISKPQLFIKFWRGRDRYISQRTGFSWSYAIESKAAALVFQGAASDVYGYEAARKLPADAEHMSVFSGESSIIDLINRDSTGSPDQLTIPLPGYHRKLCLPPNVAHMYSDETWLQKGNMETPIHMDHGRVLAYIPPSAAKCFKVWVFFDRPKDAEDFNVKKKEADSLNRMPHHPRSSVLIQRPGDVVYMNSLVNHSVRVGYLQDTPEGERWAAVSGCVVIRHEDKYDSYQYATQVGGGSRKGSRQAWQSILSAYCVMEGRDWLDENYKEERQRFLAALPRSTLSSATSTSTKAMWTKKRKRDELMKKVRAQRKNKSNSQTE